MIFGPDLVECSTQILRPLDTSLISFSSVDVTLGEKFWVPTLNFFTETIDLSDIPKEEEIYDLEEIRDNKHFLLPPGGFCKAITEQYFSMPHNIVGMFSLRSAMAQAGLEQSTSVWIRPDWKGHLVLELSNLTNKNLILRPGLRIGQIHFFELHEPDWEW